MVDDFGVQGCLAKPDEEVSTFSDHDIAQHRLNKLFPSLAIFRAFDPCLRSDSVSPSWICFPVSKFEVIFPADTSSRTKIEEFLKILSPREISKIKSVLNIPKKISRSTRSNTHFVLSDMDSLLTGKKEGKTMVVKKESSSQPVLGGKKRKVDTEVIDIEISDCMEPHDVKKKAESMMQSLTSHFINNIEDERKISQKAK